MEEKKYDCPYCGSKLTGYEYRQMLAKRMKERLERVREWLR